MAALWQLGALQLADLIRKQETTSRQVLDALLARVDAVNGDLNAVVALVPEAAAAADAADRAVAEGAELGPLHGVPITVKENIDVAGSATTNGVPAFEDARAPLDAPVVERMRAAGAIPFARTNLPDFGLRVHTDSALRGLTRNPWRQDVTAGGSSGGEGSALASGMSPLGLGNDIGGSLRNPAHCCGIASIKPSTGVVPHASSLPPVEQTIMFQLMAVQGVMARRVADVRAGLLAVAGAHVRDPLALPVELAEPLPGAVLRVAVLPEPPGCDTHPGIAAAIRATAELLAADGHIVEDIAPAGFERTGDVWSGLLTTELRSLRPLLDSVMGDGGRTFLDHAMSGTPVFDTEGVTYLHLERNAADLEWHAFLTDWDVLLTPTWTQPPFRHGADLASAEGALAVLDQLRPVLPANLLGLPAAVVPCAVVDGLPVGAQFTARRFADLTVLTAAQAVEDAVGTFTPIDPVLG
ncbi:MAG: amidase [Ilumatobacteraceae bacterium]